MRRRAYLVLVDLDDRVPEPPRAGEQLVRAALESPAAAELLTVVEVTHQDAWIIGESPVTPTELYPLYLD